MFIEFLNPNIVSNTENRVIASTKNQSQNIPFFYKIVDEKKSVDTSKKQQILNGKTKKSIKVTKNNK